MTELAANLAQMPIIAVLRGVGPEQVVPIAETLVESGIRVVEVPLTSPESYESLKLLIAAVPSDVLVGCGTITTTEQIDRARDMGARLIVSPHADPDLVVYATRHGLASFPGFATPTEALSMVKHGASALKYFPAKSLGALGLKEVRVILPQTMLVAAFGGISALNMHEFWQAGAGAFGVGSSIYRRGWTANQVRKAVLPVVEAARQFAIPQRLEKKTAS